MCTDLESICLSWDLSVGLRKRCCGDCTMNVKAATAILLVFAGCCTNVVFMEYIVKCVAYCPVNCISRHVYELSGFYFHRADPGSGNLVTFLQFLFIALEGFIFTAKCGTARTKIPFSAYYTLVAMFFVVSVCNNYAFDFNIPMPLHMIFRAVRTRDVWSSSIPINYCFFLHCNRVR